MQKLRSDFDNPYDDFHRTVEVQVFPQNLRATWDDTGCCFCMLLFLVAASCGSVTSGLYYYWTQTNESQINASSTWALFVETCMLITCLFCACLIAAFVLMCLCGLHTQVMAARKRRFGSLRKNRVLLSLMLGHSAWDEPKFQRRLRQADRRLEQVRDTVEARLESWLSQREARVKYMLMKSVRYEIAKNRTKTELKGSKSAASCCNLL